MTSLLAAGALTALVTFGYLLGFQRVARLFPAFWGAWIEALAFVVAAGLIGLFVAVLAWRSIPNFQSPRRRFLKSAGATLAMAPYACTAAGIIERDRFRLSEVKIPIPNLPKDLDGLKIVQISDVHLSAFLSEKQFARVIDMANETRADLAVVTGDLISRPGDPLDACLGQLKRLRADAGIFGCHGNHEVYTRTEDYITEKGKQIGIDYLRQDSRQVRFGSATINFAGVDYQRFGFPYLAGAERLLRPDALNILLSHNPDVFPVAARQGFDLTLSGHTHGGQVNVEILHQNLNVARYFTDFVRGLYRLDKSAIYVCSGIGTIGLPVRIGAPPEVSLIQLCAS